ncbi:MAG: hypothetical protein KatS3mg090_1019 [Patescibacteria group bacterium]|nr:MAG: hypothetical protein KatS3mg090_1019 [Patescibacteria group bacterium]
MRRPENLVGNNFIEQLIVSGSVLRQDERLPPELIKHHKNLISGLGLSVEAVSGLSKEDLLNLLDKVQSFK